LETDAPCWATPVMADTLLVEAGDEAGAPAVAWPHPEQNRALVGRALPQLEQKGILCVHVMKRSRGVVVFCVRPLALLAQQIFGNYLFSISFLFFVALEIEIGAISKLHESCNCTQVRAYLDISLFVIQQNQPTQIFIYFYISIQKLVKSLQLHHERVLSSHHDPRCLVRCWLRVHRASKVPCGLSQVLRSDCELCNSVPNSDSSTLHPLPLPPFSPSPSHLPPSSPLLQRLPSSTTSTSTAAPFAPPPHDIYFDSFWDDALVLHRRRMSKCTAHLICEVHRYAIHLSRYSNPQIWPNL
jgi:hypothetical protein